MARGNRLSAPKSGNSNGSNGSDSGYQSYIWILFCLILLAIILFAIFYPRRQYNMSVQNGNMMQQYPMMQLESFEDSDKKYEDALMESTENNDDPEKILYQNMDKLLYKESPYAYSIDNIEYHKKLFEYDKVIEMYKLFYQPNNMILSIVSNIPFENIKKSIKKTFFSKPFIQKQLINKPNINEGNINCFLSNEGNIQYNIQKK